MPAHIEADAAAEPCYVSTGHLPEPDLVMTTVKRAYERFKKNTEGRNSDVYPALARVPSDLFGVCVVGTSGNVYQAGDADHEFSIMSVSKPFVFALVCQCLGAEEARDKLGVNSTRAAVQCIVGDRTGPRRTHQPDGQSRGDRDDKPRARRDCRCALAVHPRRAFRFRRTDAAAQCRGVCVGVRDQFPESEHCATAAELWADLSRSGRSDRSCTPGNVRSTYRREILRSWVRRWPTAA